jgi:hypothetical protein
MLSELKPISRPFESRVLTFTPEKEFLSCSGESVSEVLRSVSTIKNKRAAEIPAATTIKKNETNFMRILLLRKTRSQAIMNVYDPAGKFVFRHK